MAKIKKVLVVFVLHESDNTKVKILNTIFEVRWKDGPSENCLKNFNICDCLFTSTFIQVNLKSQFSEFSSSGWHQVSILVFQFLLNDGCHSLIKWDCQRMQSMIRLSFKKSFRLRWKIKSQVSKKIALFRELNSFYSFEVIILLLFREIIKDIILRCTQKGSLLSILYWLINVFSDLETMK